MTDKKEPWDIVDYFLLSFMVIYIIAPIAFMIFFSWVVYKIIQFYGVI